MSEEKAKRVPGPYAVEEFKQLCESVRVLENTLWIAAAAYFAILGFTLQWLLRAETVGVTRVAGFVLLLVIEVAAYAALEGATFAGRRMTERIGELSEVMEMSPKTPTALLKGRRAGTWAGRIQLAIVFVATLALLVFRPGGSPDAAAGSRDHQRHHRRHWRRSEGKARHRASRCGTEDSLPFSLPEDTAR